MDASPPPPPYSLPWQLRPAVAATFVRADTSFASYEDGASNHGLTIASTLTAGYRVPGTGGPGEGLVPLLRLALAEDSPPTGSGGFVAVDPLVGAAYALRLPHRAGGSAGRVLAIDEARGSPIPPRCAPSSERAPSARGRAPW